MSINKNAYLRYLTLDKCFNNKHKFYFIEDLLAEVNKALEDFNGQGSKIKKRQLFEDIKFMESEAGWSIPLERIKDGKKVYYSYIENGYSINNQKISDEELDAINSALMVLVRFRGIPQFEWVNELVPKLQLLFKPENSPGLISFDQNEFLTGLDYLPLLYKNIVNETALLIEYQSFRDQTPTQFLVYPYFLKQYNKRWFLFALNDQDKLIYNLALDRIKGIKADTKTFIKNSSIDFNEYFEDLVGVSFTPGLKPIKINLHFCNEIAPYILTKPIHGSQKKIAEDSQGMLIQLEVIPNFELKQLLLSYGDGVEVISPKSFRNDIYTTIRKMEIQYTPDL